MKPTKRTVFFLLVGISVLFTANGLHAQSKPVLLFSDLTWGPKTGWEGSSTKGAAVTVWGTGFGSTKGTVTVNGGQATDYAEWGVTGTANHVARGLERITFWLNSSMADGAGTISVTVGGVTSNALPFNITTGGIYFVSGSDGNDSYNGKYATRTGHTGSDGPFRSAYKFNPRNNAMGDSQYIFYVREGTYTGPQDPYSSDGGSAFIQLYGGLGGPTAQKAFVAYPGEVPVFDLVNMHYGLVYQSCDRPTTKSTLQNDYFTWSKLRIIGSTYPQGAIDTQGQYDRIIGCSMANFRPTSQLQSGVIWVGGSQYASIYGNLVDNFGFDSMMHGLYIKTQQEGYPTSNYDIQTREIDVGWNEFANSYSSDNHGGVIFISKGGTNVPPGGTKDTMNIFIHDNYFHDGSQGEWIYSGDGYDFIDGVYIYNNIFGPSSGQAGGILVGNGTKGFYLWNNTFYQSVSAGDPLVYVAYQTQAQINSTNNIYYGLPGQRFIYVDGAGSVGWKVTSNNDLFFAAGGGTGIPKTDDYGSSGKFTVVNAKSGDPKFVTPGSNYHLQSGSPAIDVGASTVSSKVTKDYDGVPRPQGSGYDIGAFEY
ncbi:MAG: choice-of-anchor Q domain-containing protein, partial [Thermodesulfobacteriota bacterium]